MMKNLLIKSIYTEKIEKYYTNGAVVPKTEYVLEYNLFLDVV